MIENEWPFIVFDEEGDLVSICMLSRERGGKEKDIADYLEKNPELLDRIEEGLAVISSEYRFAGGDIDLLCVTKTELSPVLIELKNWRTGKWARDAYNQLKGYIDTWNATRHTDARGYLVIPVIGWFKEYPAEYGLLWNILGYFDIDQFWALEQSFKSPFTKNREYGSIWTRGSIFDGFLSKYHLRYLEVKDDKESKRTYLLGGLVNNPVTREFVKTEYQRSLKQSREQFRFEDYDLPNIQSAEEALSALEKESLEIQLAFAWVSIEKGGKRVESSISEALAVNRSLELHSLAKEVMTAAGGTFARLKAVEITLATRDM